MWSATEPEALMRNVEFLSLAIHHDFLFFPTLAKANEINTFQIPAAVSQQHVFKYCYLAFFGCWLKKQQQKKPATMWGIVNSQITFHDVIKARGRLRG